jgi:hypothetical protein
VWTREISESLWRHTHIQLHLPKLHTGRVAGELVAFLGSAFGFPRLGLKAELGSYWMWNQSMRAGGLRYLLKGFDHRDFRYLSPDETVNVAAAIGIEHRGTQGEVPIKRAGVSQNIGRAARRAAGWTERRDLADLRAILRPPETPKAPPKLVLGRRGLRPVYLKSGMGKEDPQRSAAHDWPDRPNTRSGRT